MVSKTTLPNILKLASAVQWGVFISLINKWGGGAKVVKSINEDEGIIVEGGFFLNKGGGGAGGKPIE